MFVMNGSGGASGKLDSDVSRFALKVEQSVQIPSAYNRATVFLNGWQVNYLGDDQNVLGLGTLITNIRFEDQRLTWDAAGLLRDDDADEEYNWKYHFTVIAWNSTQINAVVDHGSGNICSDNFFYAKNDGTTTALSAFSSFINNPAAFTSSRTVAGVPRGFVMAWAGGSFWDWLVGADNHLLQLAYNLDHTEIFVENKKKYKKGEAVIAPPLPTAASHVGSGFVSWNSYAILKDDDARRDSWFGEVVSGMGGSDVGVLQPPFSLRPLDPTSCPEIGGAGVKTEEFVIDSIPFEYAVPMLTGWDLQYGCDDQHVKEIGVWIEDDWSYSAGTLRYKLSSILRDDDNDPEHFRRHKVSVLGLRPLARVAAGKR
jgi:hypothetical protein